jgi:hypothetical protein
VSAETAREARVSPLELSYVLVTAEPATVRGVLAHLGRQTRAGAVELVLVAPREIDPAAAELPRELGGVRAVRCPAPIELPVARALGVRAASAPVVFIGETHSFPEPEMVERLLAAFAEGWDAVVPAIVNANPRTGRSWAAFLLDYARWGPEAPPAELAEPLFYNAAFRRDALFALGEGLVDALSSIDRGAWEPLGAAGRRARFEPAARIRHLNVSLPGALLRERLLCGLRLGRFRARRWGWPRRLAYATAAPLVPLVLAARVRRVVSRAVARGGLPLSTLPWLAIALAARAAGEGLGYLGAGRSAEAAETEIELNRTRYIVESP